MRAVVVVTLFALLSPVGALAQTAAVPAPASPAANPPSARGADISRDAYVERARHNAERRFDRMDSDHNGVLTAEERRSYRAAHARHRDGETH